MLPSIDYFDSVGQFLQGCWHLISDGVAHIALLPQILRDSAEWASIGVEALPASLVAVLPTALGGVLLFRFLRM